MGCNNSTRGSKSEESSAADGKDVQVRRVRMAKGQQEEPRREAQKATGEAKEPTEDVRKAAEEAKEAAEEAKEAAREAKDASGEAKKPPGEATGDERSERREQRERSQYELRSKWRFDIKEDKDEKDIFTIV